MSYIPVVNFCFKTISPLLHLVTSLCSSISFSSNSECSNANISAENSWFSQISDCDSAQPQLVSSNPIPVVIGYRPPKVTINNRQTVRQVIRRENKCIQALSLQTILSYNMRSIWSKLVNFSTNMQERSADISFLCEVWEKSESRKHQQKIEELLEMNGILYISTPRPGAKRGGGNGIAFNPTNFTVSKLNILIPKPLEVVWALMRPVNPTGDIRKIILCSFYSPPNSKKNNQLIEQISVTYNHLKIQHPDKWG